MNFYELKRRAGVFYPVFALDHIFFNTWSKRLSLISSFVAGVSFIFVAFLFISERVSFPEILYPLLANLDVYLDLIKGASNKITGIFLMALSVQLALVAFRSFYHSYYFQGLEAVLSPEHTRGVESITLEVAQVVNFSEGGDLVKEFVLSPKGQMVLFRLGISDEAVRSFLQGRKNALPVAGFSVEESPVVTLGQYVRALFKADKEFVQFLFSEGVQEKELVRAAEWDERTHMQYRKKERWWSRDNLGRVPAIGKDWSYGAAYLLEQYGHAMTEDPVYFSSHNESQYGSKEVDALEKVLARSRNANALLVGEEGSGKREVLAKFTRKIEEGTILPPLGGRRVFILDGEALVAAMKEKGAFEAELIKILNQAVKAGNIILAIENFPAFLKSAQALNSDVVSILDPYLKSPQLQMIATSDLSNFHQLLEPNTLLMESFDTVTMSELKGEGVLYVLEDVVRSIESREGVFFTLPALETIAESAERYFSSGVMPDKAVDLMVELVPSVKKQGKRVVGKGDVLALVEAKTGIPLGEVGEKEQEMLLNLEKKLHERVVWQDEAVSAISNAIRRSRTGVRNPNRPIGSFLFLGPTGVGKTETAKALAAVFFGSESRMIRLDMSEYRTEDSLERLIGSFGSGKVGTFASALREKPYGVLLLDEFEKTSKEITDFFLSVLDEGEFKDVSGKRVNARELIIIATSNAGSDLIRELSQKGENLESHKKELIDEIIKKGIFKPELLNRFDGTIVFHPLDEAKIRVVAASMLKKLQKRLEEQGVKLVISETLLDFLAKVGYDPEFGARPMNRAIQEKVEQVIADKLLRGTIKPGDSVELSAEDLGGTP